MGSPGRADHAHASGTASRHRARPTCIGGAGWRGMLRSDLVRQPDHAGRIPRLGNFAKIATLKNTLISGGKDSFHRVTI